MENINYICSTARWERLHATTIFKKRVAVELLGCCEDKDDSCASGRIFFRQLAIYMTEKIITTRSVLERANSTAQMERMIVSLMRP